MSNYPTTKCVVCKKQVEESWGDYHHIATVNAEMKVELKLKGQSCDNCINKLSIAVGNFIKNISEEILNEG